MLSFIGFVPSSAPRLVILALLDEPKTVVWGSEAAAPIFAAVAGPVLRHLEVAPTEAVPADPDREIGRYGTPSGKRRSEPAAGMSPDGEALMPDLTGKSLRQALALLGTLDVDVAVAGRGIVVKQTPAPGTPLGPGAACRLELAPPSAARRWNRDERTAAPREIPMGTLLEAVPERQLLGSLPATVRGLTDDSRKVASGDCFVAVQGASRRRPPLHPPGGRARRAGRRGGAARSLARRGGGADTGAG